MANEIELLSVKEVCSLLNLGKTSFYKIVDGGELIAIKIGSSTRVRRTDLEAWLELQPRYRPRGN